jgi:outer membrane protein assembly factor BamB
MKKTLIFLIMFALLSQWQTPAADWPTYQGDYARSGVSDDPLPRRLLESWSWKSPQRPQPAWQGEAKWDGYNKVYDMKARQIFDRAFHTVVVDGRVYFGSSADDQIHCLDVTTGKEIWTFFTEGPVRFAPSIIDGRAYFGSDDGNVYCVDALNGKLIWKQRAVETDRRIPGNGRVISNWPVRTSVVVQNGNVYTTAGMFPSEGVHLVALDALTGLVKWRQIQTDLPAQGYLLASSTRLYVPAGRNNPVVCDITDGKRLRVVEGAGGTYALLTDDMLVFGPGKTGQLGAVEAGRKDQLATFQGNHMIVRAGRSYLHSDTSLSALDRARYLDLARERKGLSGEQGKLAKELRELAKKKDKEATAARQKTIKEQLAVLGQKIDATTEGMRNCVLWQTSSEWPLSLLLAGDTLVVGGGGEIAGFNSDRGTLRWKHAVDGNVYGLAAANGVLLVSTDKGVIHCLRAGEAHASIVPTSGQKEVLR